MKKSFRKYIVEYYFNESRHWAEVYDNWTIASDTIKEVMNKYTLYKVEVVPLDSV